MLVASPFQQWLRSGLLACYFVLVIFGCEFFWVFFVLWGFFCFVCYVLLRCFFSFVCLFFKFFGWLVFVGICFEFGGFPLFLWLLVCFGLLFGFSFEGLWRRFGFVCVGVFLNWVGSFTCPSVWLVWFGLGLGCLFVVIIGVVCLFWSVFFPFPNTLSYLPVLELHWRS